jgi:AmmeMemoRadiSam system protein A
VETLSQSERNALLDIARQAIVAAVNGEKPAELNLNDFSPMLRAQGASFVTLTENGDLRGCIGTLSAYQPLIVDVQEHAVAAALDDPRFMPVSAEEVQNLEIEISRLTQPQILDYANSDDLLAKFGREKMELSCGMNGGALLICRKSGKKIPNRKTFLTACV